MSRLPSITSVLPPDVRRFLDRVRELFEGSKRAVNVDDLVSTGQFAFNNDKLSSVDSGITGCAAPPAPVTVEAFGAMTSITLTWEGTNYGTDCHAYTEIWRADTDNITQAQIIAQATGEIYSDAVGSDAKKYYWLRFVNTNDIIGSYHATAGVLGETAPDLPYVMEQLTRYYGATSEAPFFQIDQDTTITLDDDTELDIAAGTYIDTAFIADAAITNAKIGLLSADKIVAGEMSGARITAGTLDADRIDVNTLAAGFANVQVAWITDAQIVSLSAETLNAVGAWITEANVDILKSIDYDAGVAGWRIDKDGQMEMNNATFRGQLDIKSNTDGARMEMNNNVLKVFDANGQLRIKMGDLSA